ncbi:hypothetical protein BS47DRAFT_1357695 [Hydnum rufescens UP504]|uniref:Uncharacterized protein n=1 Tax=Hydnum rufescens UP504 TaxID=1448309 RepID=A0A9P6BB26_9AGAM|nr:hypothetical protein BS47DRAFT_1357695 [Hydnum rufescens UP504]
MSRARSKGLMESKLDIKKRKKLADSQSSSPMKNKEVKKQRWECGTGSHRQYTTYDVHHAQDTINVHNTHRDIMVYSQEDDIHHGHKYGYACVHGIFHANVIHPKCLGGERMEFVWVWWFEHDTTHHSGWKSKHLDHIKFISHANQAFGFLDPAFHITMAELKHSWGLHTTVMLKGIGNISMSIGHLRTRRTEPVVNYEQGEDDMNEIGMSKHANRAPPSQVDWDHGVGVDSDNGNSDDGLDDDGNEIDSGIQCNQPITNPATPWANFRVKD